MIHECAGVEKVDIDAGKDLVTVKGTMDAKALVPYLTEKLKRPVEVVPPKKDEGGDKKPKEGGGGGDGDKKKEGGGGGDKKEKEGGGGGDGGKKEEGGGKKEEGGAKVEVSKMEYHGYPYAQPSYWFNGHAYDQNYPAEVHQGYVNHAQNYPVEVHQGYGYVNQGYPNEVHQGYAAPHVHAMHAPQLFSDENPNACSVM